MRCRPDERPFRDSSHKPIVLSRVLQSVGRALISVSILFFGWVASAADGYCTNSWKSIFHGVFRDRSGNVIRKMPISHGVIVDSNVLGVYVETVGRRSSDIEKMIHRMRKIRRQTLKSDGQFRMYVTDKTAAEVGGSNGPDRRGFPFPIETRRVLLSVERDSDQYRDVMAKLVEHGVGQAKKKSGVADQEIVADAFFAETLRGEPATFLTADRGIIIPLCNLSPTCKGSIAKGQLETDLTDGFVVELPDGTGATRRLRILPLFGR